MAVINELVTQFSFHGNISPLDDFNKQLKSSIGWIGGLGAAMAASLGVVTIWAGGVTAALGPLNRYGEATGIAIDQLHAYGFAASQVGSSQEEINDSLEEFAGRIGETVATGAGAAKEAYDLLGISIRDAGGKVKDTDMLFNEVADKFADGSLSEERKSFFVEEVGLHRELIPLLNKGSAGMKTLTDRARELGVLSKEDSGAIKDLNTSLGAMDFGMTALKNTMAIALAPQLTELAESFTDFLADNKELIKEGIGKTAEFLSDLGKAFVRVLPTIGLITGAFAAWKIATIGLNMVLLANPIGLMVAGIGLAIIAVDDLTVAFMGGDSVIAEWFKNLTGQDLKPVMESFGEAGILIGKVLGGVGKFIGGALIDSIKLLHTTATGVTEILYKLISGDFKGASAKGKQLWQDSGKLIKDIFEGVFEGLAALFEGVFHVEIASFDETTKALEKAFKDAFASIAKWWDELINGFARRLNELNPFRDKKSEQDKDFRSSVLDENNNQSSLPAFDDNGIIQKSLPQTNISNSTNTTNQDITVNVKTTESNANAVISGVEQGFKSAVKDINIHNSRKDGM